MDQPLKTDAEQQDFFDRVYERFLRASAAVGTIKYYYRIGGTSVIVAFAGENLVSHLTPALEHLRIPETSSADLTICVWDSDSTAIDMVPPPCTRECFTDRGDIWGFNSRRIKTAFHWIECSVNLMDLATNTAIFWVQTSLTLPYWVYASPLRTLLHWWMEKQECQLLHAAAVGAENGAVLITGKGGVGKSTTALSCLNDGMNYLGDDYVIIRGKPEPVVYSLYCTAKLNADHVSSLPEISELVANPDSLDEEKAVMFLQSNHSKQIVSEMPLIAIVTPSIVNHNKTLLKPVERWTIQRAMSFTTMSQLPYVGRHTHDFISKLAATLPCYTLELGSDLKQAPKVISSLPVRHSAGHSHYQKSDLDEIQAATKPLVSVIIPLYNGERFIEDSVNNILSQDYPAIEIIVVDDGSTDRSGEIINSLPVDIRYFKQDNNGPASARNRGIRDASGEFILSLDVDDLWPENNLNRLVDEMRCNPDAGVIRGFAQITEYNEVTGEYDFMGNPGESFPDYIGAAIFRKSVFRKVGLFDNTLNFGEDVDWFARASELKINMMRLEEVTLYVRRHGMNMTHGKSLIELNTLRVLKKSIDRTRAKT